MPTIKILNLTQHNSTDEQIVEGVFEPENKTKIQKILTFATPPNYGEMAERALQLVEIATKEKAQTVMIGGAPYFMSVLEKHLFKAGIEPVHAFTTRTVVEKKLADGTIQKNMQFRHAGWVKAWRKSL